MSTSDSTLCCDRCGRLIGTKAHTSKNGWIICGVCEWEEDQKHKINGHVG